ncbi:unnamed protein product [Polarella glacialis]|uniref:Uncharacterized protein n=1 Tax=Polarella glacialis TaxID=89957 RepID=A0A813GUS8_POLGL|nr:unnamed protein product [Polarella glacialis]
MHRQGLGHDLRRPPLAQAGALLTCLEGQDVVEPSCSSRSPAASSREARSETLQFRGDHDWHYQYDRRLASFSKRISSLAFACDGRWLFGGSSSSDMRLWDTRHWSEATRLKSSKRQEPRCLAVSTCGNWLVAMQPGALNIYAAEAPWPLEQVLLPMTDPNTGEATEWCCASFSPGRSSSQTEEVGTFLAAFSTTHLLLLDYAAGWSPNLLSQRSHSLPDPYCSFIYGDARCMYQVGPCSLGRWLHKVALCKAHQCCIFSLRWLGALRECSWADTDLERPGRLDARGKTLGAR